MNPTTIERVERQSVQVLPDARENGGVTASTSDFWLTSTTRSELLPAPYTYECERLLRYYDRHNAAVLWHGAKSGQIKKVGATGYNINGGRNLTNHFADVLAYSNFGAGFAQMIEMIYNDYLTYNRGGFMEIIAPGNPLRPISSRITALAHLDAYHCMPTGDPQYPVLYTDRDGKQHLMERSHVVQFIDTPDGDQDHPGFGRSALWRAIHVLWQEVLSGRYVVAKLDDKPPPGMVLVSGMTREKWNAIWNQYHTDQSMDERPEWGKNVPVFGADVTLKPTVEMVPFSTPPEQFDYQVYTELNVHKLALAMGIDIQEIWELTGNSLGSGMQSEVQHSKSQGKLYGEFLSTFERAMNHFVLPASLEFTWEVRDPMESAVEADNAKKWVDVGLSMQSLMGPEKTAQFIAANVPSLAKVLTDEDGVITLPDTDPKADEPLEVTVDDAAPNSDAPEGEQVTAQDDTPNANAGAKDYAETRSQFVANFTDLTQAGLADDVSRRRAGVVMRAQIARLGRTAYGDGLKAGGVEDRLTEDDLATVTVLIAEQSGYVTDYLNGVYTTGLTDAEVTAHASMWANKSLQPFYDAGLLSADANGLYEWVLGDAEHCASCLRMNGQKHRLKEYNDKVLPKSDKLECGGFNCACSLVRTSGRARGGWL